MKWYKVTLIEPGAFRTPINGRSVLPEHLIEDYAATSGEMLKWLREMDGKQPGDPKKAAAAMIQVVASDRPPLRLALGADAVDRINTKLETVKQELDAWQQVALNTAYEDVK